MTGKGCGAAAVGSRAKDLALCTIFGLALAILAGRAQAQAQAIASVPPSAEQNPNFAIWEFRVLGNTTLPVRDVESAVYPFLGDKKSLADVEQARDALVAAYRKAGFGTVSIDIPVQSVDDGIVRLAVLEGRLERVEVKGARYFSGRQIRAALPALKTGDVPNTTDLQAQLGQLAHASADRTVTPALRAGSAPGEVQAVLNVEDHLPVHGSIEVDNRHTADTSPVRMSGTLSYDYLFNRPQSLSVQYQTAPGDASQVKAWAVSWMEHSGDASQWSAYFVDSNSDVAALGTVGVLGTGTVVGVRRTTELLQDAKSAVSASIAFDYKSFGESVYVTPGDGSGTPIHYGQITASMAGNFGSGGWTMTGNGGATFGIRGLVNEDDEFQYKRYGANADFFYLRSQMKLTRSLPWSMTATLRLETQWSPSPLVANEQFSLGGVDTVRGYLEAEVLADTAAAGSLELASPRWSSNSDPLRAYTISGLVFLDAGIGLLEQPLPGEVSPTHLSSYGLGLVLTGPHQLSGLFDAAYTLSPGTRTGIHTTNVNFMLSKGF